jgi:hypothetical protein
MISLINSWMWLLYFPGGHNDSRASPASGGSHSHGNQRHAPARPSSNAVAAPPISDDIDETSSLAEEGVKLSLFARAKAVEDQVWPY